MFPSRARCGFSLIELLGVIAILAFLLGLLLPAVQKVRAAAARTQCANNMKQHGLALHNFHDANGTFPAGVSDPNATPALNCYWSWMAQILPYVEQDNLYRAADAWQRQGGSYQTRSSPQYWWPWGEFWTSPPTTPPNPALGTLVKTWECPADGRTLVATDLSGMTIAFTAYLGVAGTRGDTAAGRNGILFYLSKTRMADIIDGTSNTAMVGERPPSSDLYFGWWFAGAGYDGKTGIGSGTGDVVLGAREVDYAASLSCPVTAVGLQPGQPSVMCDQAHFWSLHTGGANFLMGDGSVKFLTYSADAVLPQMCTRNGGEVYNVP
jgi:prepilin-type processing-associated H-X9-DG protein/prepilin-type N-terminal cleavage/methylation domain-containing protein